MSFSRPVKDKDEDIIQYTTVVEICIESKCNTVTKVNDYACNGIYTGNTLFTSHIQGEDCVIAGNITLPISSGFSSRVCLYIRKLVTEYRKLLTVYRKLLTV